MFRSQPDADHTRGLPSQEGEARDDPHQQWRMRFSGVSAVEDGPDDAVLRLLLHELDRSGRKGAAALDKS